MVSGEARSSMSESESSSLSVTMGNFWWIVVGELSKGQVACWHCNKCDCIPGEVDMTPTLLGDKGMSFYTCHCPK